MVVYFKNHREQRQAFYARQVSITLVISDWKCFEFVDVFLNTLVLINYNQIRLFSCFSYTSLGVCGHTRFLPVHTKATVFMYNN